MLFTLTCFTDAVIIMGMVQPVFGTVLLFPQGVWSCHFPHVRPEHVHPVCSEGPLWLRHVCPHPAGLGGGTEEEKYSLY